MVNFSLLLEEDIKHVFDSAQLSITGYNTDQSVLQEVNLFNNYFATYTQLPIESQSQFDCRRIQNALAVCYRKRKIVAELIGDEIVLHFPKGIPPTHYPSRDEAISETNFMLRILYELRNKLNNLNVQRIRSYYKTPSVYPDFKIELSTWNIEFPSQNSKVYRLAKIDLNNFKKLNLKFYRKDKVIWSNVNIQAPRVQLAIDATSWSLGLLVQNWIFFETKSNPGLLNDAFIPLVGDPDKEVWDIWNYVSIGDEYKNEYAIAI